MKIVIEISTDNAAFEENDNEMHDCLQNVINAIALGFTEGYVLDSNGNTVGNYKVTTGGGK